MYKYALAHIVKKSNNHREWSTKCVICNIMLIFHLSVHNTIGMVIDIALPHLKTKNIRLLLAEDNINSSIKLFKIANLPTYINVKDII